MAFPPVRFSIQVLGWFKGQVSTKNVQLKEKTSVVFSKRKTEKKKAFVSSEGMQINKGGAKRSLFHPCFFVSPQLIFAGLFLVYDNCRLEQKGKSDYSKQ